MVAILAVLGPDVSGKSVLLPLGLPIAALFAYVVVTADPAWLMSLSVVLSVFSSHWGDVGVGVPLDRLCLLGAITSVALRIPLDPRRWRWPRIHSVHVAILLSGIWVVLSAYRAGTIHERKALFEMLDGHGFFPWVFFLLAPLVYRTAHQRKILLGMLTACGGYLGFIAVAEGLHLRSLVFPSYISDARLLGHADRARGPFIEAGAMGLALWAGLLAASGLIVVDRRPLVRILSVAVCLLCGVGIVFTLTRAVWIGAVAGLLSTVFLPSIRRYSLRLIGGTAAALILALIAFPGLRSELQHRAQDKTPIYDRYNSNGAGLRLFEAHPLFGSGWDSYNREKEPYFRIGRTYPITTPVADLHEVFLSNLAELGLLGFSLWLAAILLGIGIGLRRFGRGPPDRILWQTMMVVFAVCWAVDANFTPLTYAFPNTMLWLLIGMSFPVRARLGEVAVARERSADVAVRPEEVLI